MDFIEQWFGVSPDGGDGTTELLIVAVVLLLLVAIVTRRWIARRITRNL